MPLFFCMKNYFFFLFIALSGLLQCAPTYGQNSNIISLSDSMLFQQNLKGALDIVDKGSFTSDAKNSETQLRKNYLLSVSNFQKGFKEEFFSKSKAIIDTILARENFPLNSKKIYLNHFLSTSSRNFLTNSERIAYCNKGLLIAQNSKPSDTLFMIHFLFEKGSAEFENEMYKDAIKNLKISESMCSKYEKINPNMLPKIFFKLGLTLSSFAGTNADKGYEYLQKSEQIFLSIENPDSFFLANVYDAISDVAWGYRDYDKGMKYVKKSMDLFSKIDLDQIMSPTEQIQNKYHLYYKEMQFYQDHQKKEALNLLTKAEIGYPAYKNNPEIKLRMAAMYNFMGEFYIRSAPEKSAPFYLKAIKTFDNPESEYHLQYLFNLGKAYLYSGNAQKCLEYSSELIALAEKSNDANLPHFYFLKAFAFVNLDNFEKALEISNTVIKYMDPKSKVDLIEHQNLRTFDPPIHKVVYINLLSRMGLAFKNGFSNNNSALNVANSLFQLGIIEYGKSIKSAKVTHYTKSMYEQLVWGIISTKDFLKIGDLNFSELIEFSENTNEKYLWANYKSNSGSVQFFDKELLAEEDTLRTELIRLKNEAINDTLYDFSVQIFDINLQLEKIDKKKRKSNSSYYNYEDSEFEFGSFQSKLSPNTIMLKYEFLMDSLFLFEISQDQIHIRNINTDSLFFEQIDQVYYMVSDPSSNQDSLNQKLTQISKILLPEIKNNTSNLVIKTDDKLSFLPFDLLRRNGKYLIEDYSISYINALGLYENEKNLKRVNKALVLAPSYNDAVNNSGLLAERGDEFNLSGVLEEGKILGTILPGEVLLGENALKSKFIKMSGNYDLIHFSMHSILNDDDSELNNLAFHDGESDNKLYISELYGMQLNAKLAVLSACNTSIGKEKTGDGIISLNRAFTFAGVPSVVSSLWSAPDRATKEIMINFYKYLENRIPKPEALRQAKIDYIKAQNLESLKHPYYWAGFSTYGDPSPLEIKRTKINPLFYFLAISFALIALAFFIKNRNRSTMHGILPN